MNRFSILLAGLLALPSACTVTPTPDANDDARQPALVDLGEPEALEDEKSHKESTRQFINDDLIEFGTSKVVTGEDIVIGAGILIGEDGIFKVTDKATIFGKSGTPYARMRAVITKDGPVAIFEANGTGVFAEDGIYSIVREDGSRELFRVEGPRTIKEDSILAFFGSDNLGIIVKPDGTRIVIMANGTPIIFWPGKHVGVHDLNMWSRDITRYGTFFGADGIVVAIRPDGTRVVQRIGGSGVVIRPDGGRIVSKADGTRIVNKPHEPTATAKIIRGSDGTRDIIREDGTREIVGPDGARVIFAADGTRSVIGSDGATLAIMKITGRTRHGIGKGAVIRLADGTAKIESAAAEGMRATIRADGSGAFLGMTIAFEAFGPCGICDTQFSKGLKRLCPFLFPVCTEQ